MQLQGNPEIVLGPTRPEPEEHLAGDEHLAHRPPLLSIEVGEAFGIRLVGPGQPEFLDGLLEFGVADLRRRLDPRADDIAGAGFDRVGGVAVVAHQVPGRAP